MDYVFPPGRRTRFCLLERPHGTLIEVQVDYFDAWQWEGKPVRTHHLDLHGGLASSETGYRSHFLNHGPGKVTEDYLVDFALDFAQQRFLELQPGGQLGLFAP